MPENWKLLRGKLLNITWSFPIDKKILTRWYLSYTSGLSFWIVWLVLKGWTIRHADFSPIILRSTMLNYFKQRILWTIHQKNFVVLAYNKTISVNEISIGINFSQPKLTSKFSNSIGGVRKGIKITLENCKAYEVAARNCS